MDQETFLRRLPKAELHVHIEGTLEPEMMFEMASRNGISLPYADVDEVRAAYRFTDLQSFLDIYYEGAAVLVHTEDFRDLMQAYLRRAAADGVRRAEIFFDPQTHTNRGVGFDVFMPGFLEAIEKAEFDLGISTALIMCFLRHLPAVEAMDTWEQAGTWRDKLIAVGLDSSERGFANAPFSEVYRLAGAYGLRKVAHAGEEGPPANVSSALDDLGAERIDHGVRAEDDPAVLARLIELRIPLTVCPLSNLALKGVSNLRDHNLGRLLAAGAIVTVNSDDPAYFGGYVGDNYVAIAGALGLSRTEMVAIARNSILASFAGESLKAGWLSEIDEFVRVAGE